MRAWVRFWWFVSMVGPGVVACGASDSGGEGNDGGGAAAGGGSGSAAVSTPHALASIRLTESRDVGSDPVISAPSVGAQFKPDVAGATSACTKPVGACRTPILPECQGCTGDQICTFDATCQSVCVESCNLACATDEVCYLSSAGTPTCGPSEVFDAGSLTIAGAWQAIALTPPDYSFTGNAVVGISWFASRATLSVQAAGTMGAGFTGFDQTFTATTVLKTNLADMDPATLFGKDDVTITWPAANDRVGVTLGLGDASGKTTVLICDADDAAGKVVVPRATIQQALGGSSLSSGLVFVGRSRREIRDGFATTGILPRSAVRPNGVLDFATGSQETRQFNVCQADATQCGN